MPKTTNDENDKNAKNDENDENGRQVRDTSRASESLSAEGSATLFVVLATRAKKRIEKERNAHEGRGALRWAWFSVEVLWI